MCAYVYLYLCMFVCPWVGLYVPMDIYYCVDLSIFMFFPYLVTSETIMKIKRFHTFSAIPAIVDAIHFCLQ